MFGLYFKSKSKELTMQPVKGKKIWYCIRPVKPLDWNSGTKVTLIYYKDRWELAKLLIETARTPTELLVLLHQNGFG